MESFYLGAFWGSRRAPAAECAERLSACLAALASIDPLLTGWRHLGRSRAGAQTPVDLGARALEELLLKGRNRRDTDRSVIEELGFHVGMWNGQEAGINLSATVGAYPGVPTLMNSFGLRFPAPDGAARPLYDKETATSIVEAVAQAWEPDSATWISHSLREAQQAPRRTPEVGWLTYLDGSRLKARSAAAVGAQPMGIGWVVRAADDIADVDVQSVVALRRRLEAAGALAPIA